MSAEKIEGYPDLYTIPDFSLYGLTVEGKVFNLSRKEWVKGSPNPAGYHNFRLKGNQGNTATIGRHRLLAKVFIPCLDKERTFVNHKNGIKGDDFIDNLEWVTPRENIEHAGSMGLTTKCLPIAVLNPVTNVVSHYPSVVACARKLGKTKDAVLYRAASGGKRIFPEGLCYQYKADNMVWPDFGDLDRALSENGVAKAVLTRNVVDGSITEYEKLSDLASVLGVSPSTVSQWLTYSDQYVATQGFQIKMKRDKKPWVYIDEEVRRSRVTRPVVITDSVTLKTTHYESTAEAARDCGLSITALNYRLKNGNGRFFPDGKKYEYLHSNMVRSSSNGRVETSLIAGTP